MAEVIVLFFLSQALTKILSIWFFKIFKSETVTIQLLSLLFFPGVVVHEVSHWFMAGILFVRTGEMEFMPKITGEIVKLGSVAIAKTDPARRFMIGIAPVIIGILSFLFIFYLLSSEVPKFNWQTVILVYAFFEIGNTMFSSRKDMEGALGLFVAVFLIAVIVYFLGFRLQIDIVSLLNFSPFVSFVQRIDILILVPIAVDFALWGFSYMLRRNYRI